MITYVVTDRSGAKVLEFADRAGVVRWSDGLAESESVDGVVSSTDAAHLTAVRGSLAVAVDAAHFRALLRGAGMSVERSVDDLAGIQVRISATGHPFVPGHSSGVGKHGEIAGKISAAAASAHAASEHAAAAKSAAFLGGGAKTQAHAEEYAAAAATHASEAAKHAAVAQQHAKHAPAHAAAAAAHHAEAVAHHAEAEGHVAKHEAARKASQAVTVHFEHEDEAHRIVKLIQGSETPHQALANKEAFDKANAKARETGHEAVAHSKAAGDVDVDGSHPRDTIHYLRNVDVKADDRAKRVDAAIETIKKGHLTKTQRANADALEQADHAKESSQQALAATNAADAHQHAAAARSHANSAADAADEVESLAGGFANSDSTMAHGFKLVAANHARAAKEAAERAEAHAAKLAGQEANAPAPAAAKKPRAAKVKVPDPPAGGWYEKHQFMRETAEKLIGDPNVPVHLQLLAHYAAGLSGENERKKAYKNLQSAAAEKGGVTASYAALAKAPTKPREGGPPTATDFHVATSSVLEHYKAKPENNPPPAVAAAAHWYTYHGDQHQNRLLRGHEDREGPAGQAAAADMIPLTDAYTRANRLDHDLTLHRGMSLPKAMAAKFGKAGNRFKDPGYGSTSTSASVAHNFAPSSTDTHTRVVVTIEAPKGTHAGFITPHSHFDHESEFLLARGAVYETISSHTTNGTMHVRVRVKTPDKAPPAPKSTRASVSKEALAGVVTTASIKHP